MRIAVDSYWNVTDATRRLQQPCALVGEGIEHDHHHVEELQLLGEGQVVTAERVQDEIGGERRHGREASAAPNAARNTTPNRSENRS